MNNRIRKFIIGEKEYSFTMNNRTIFKADGMYGNYAAILYGIMNGIQYYTNAVRLMVCTCIEGVTEDEIIDNCTSEQMTKIPELAQDIYFDYIGIERKSDEKQNKNTEKN